MILSLALQVEHVLLFEFRIFSFGKICFILSLTQKNIAVVKRGDKPHIYQIAPVGLEKAVYRQQTAPVLHRAGRGKGTVRGVDRYRCCIIYLYFNYQLIVFNLEAKGGGLNGDQSSISQAENEHLEKTSEIGRASCRERV